MLNESSVLLNCLFKEARSKEEMVVTFLAILELIRLKEIKAIQKRTFEDIEIMRNKDNMVPIDADEDTEVQS